MHSAQQPAKTEPQYDYTNHNRPRDFDIRIEVAEQREILEQSQQQSTTYRWQCSEYDF